MATVTICSLLWAVTGVSVLAVALHEHYHHETHDHHEAIEVVLHGHAHEGLPDHDHQLTAPLSASRTTWFGHPNAIVSQTSDLVEPEVSAAGDFSNRLPEPRDLGPPAYLMHCVRLT